MTSSEFLTIVIILVAIAWCSYTFSGSLRSPLVIFCIMWSLVFLIHASDFFSFYQLSSNTDACITLMITGFVVGTLFSLIQRVGPSSFVPPVPLGQYHAYAKVLWIFPVLGWLGVLLFIQTNQVKLNFDDFERLDPSYEGVNQIIREYIQKIAIPALASTCVIAAALKARLFKWLQVSGAKNTPATDSIQRKLFWYLLISAAGLFIFDVVSLKRMQTITIAASLLSAYFFVTPMQKWRTKQYAALIGLSLIFVGTISLITSSRDTIRENVLSSWLLYFSGPLAYFDSFVGYGYIDEYYYGLSSLMGLHGFSFGFLRAVPLLGIFVPGIPTYYFDRQINLNIGNNIDFNAFGTVMLDGYYDFGRLGVFALALFAGFISSLIFRKAQNSSSPFIVSMAVVTTVWVLLLPIGWPGGLQFVLGQIPLSLLAIELFLRIYKRKREKSTENGNI